MESQSKEVLGGGRFPLEMKAIIFPYCLINKSPKLSVSFGEGSRGGS